MNAPPPLLRVVDHAPAPDRSEPPTADYRPAQLRARHGGWTAERQRIFLTVLAETGSISMACTEAGVSSRSPGMLRSSSPPRG